jgi:hypothetical protein
LSEDVSLTPSTFLSDGPKKPGEAVATAETGLREETAESDESVGPRTNAEAAQTDAI